MHTHCTILSFCILASFLWYAKPASAQQQTIPLSFDQSAERLFKENRDLQIADKAIDWAHAEHQRLNAFWYPSITASGAYAHMSNKIEVKQPLSQFTDPAKDFIHSILPDDQLISSILDKIGSYSLTFPLTPADLTTIDATVAWPVFTGGKRIYANKVGKQMINIAQTDRDQLQATLQTTLVEAYFGLRLGQKVVEVRDESYQALQKHYENALKLEQNGLINKAERLFAQVSRDEAKRELESSRKDIQVAHNALMNLIHMEENTPVQLTTPLFINEDIPPAHYFKTLIEGNSYIVNRIRLQENITSNQLNIGRSAYVPTIGLFGKQTIYSHGIASNLLPRTIVGVAFSWNIFDGLDREKKIRQTKIERQSLAIGKGKAVSDLQVGVDKFYSQLQNALDNVSALNTTIAMANELVRVRQKSFQEGMATSTEVIDAEVLLSKTKVAHLLAYYQYDVALINLLALCGIPESFHQYRTDGKSDHFIFKND